MSASNRARRVIELASLIGRLDHPEELASLPDKTRRMPGFTVDGGEEPDLDDIWTMRTATADLALAACRYRALVASIERDGAEQAGEAWDSFYEAWVPLWETKAPGV